MNEQEWDSCVEPREMLIRLNKGRIVNPKEYNVGKNELVFVGNHNEDGLCLSERQLYFLEVIWKSGLLFGSNYEQKTIGNLYYSVNKKIQYLMDQATGVPSHLSRDAASVIRCVYGSPFRERNLPERCITETVQGIVKTTFVGSQIYPCPWCCDGKRLMSPCSECHGIGFLIPNSPILTNTLMPILADALEDADAPQSIIDHLRGTTCNYCQGTGEEFLVANMKCPACRGLGKLTGHHYVGCHVLQQIFDRGLSHEEVHTDEGSL